MFALPPRLGFVLAIVVGYGVLFFVLDNLAILFEVAPGVSLWYPSAGLNLALLLAFGRRYAPLVFIATLGSGLLIASPSLPVTQLVLPSLFVTLGHVAAAEWLRQRLPALELPRYRHAYAFAIMHGRHRFEGRQCDELATVRLQIRCRGRQHVQADAGVRLGVGRTDLVQRLPVPSPIQPVAPTQQGN